MTAGRRKWSGKVGASTLTESVEWEPCQNKMEISMICIVAGDLAYAFLSDH